MLEMKIAKLKDLVANARIIDESKLSTDEVAIMSKVKMKNAANGIEVEYTIVADSEANLREKKIGASTPIAKGLLGHKKVMRALATRSLSLAIFISSMPWASLAASYSEFSERSPLSRASAMAADTRGRSTLSR